MLPHIILLTRSNRKVNPLTSTWSTGIPSGDPTYWIYGYALVSVTNGNMVVSGLDWGGNTITNGSGTVLNLLCFSPQLGGSWTYVDPYPLSAQVQVAAFLDPYGYFIGGGTNSLNVYKIGMPIPNATPSGGWSAVASTNKGRAQGGLAVLGSTLYAFGGNGTPSGTTNWEYFNGSSWVNGGSLPTLLYGTSNMAKTIGSYIYMCMYPGSNTDSWYFYKFDGSTFTQLTSTPRTPRYSANTVLNGRFYFMGGSTASVYNKYVYSTDATGATWQVETDLPYGRLFGSAVTYNNNILLFGGEGDGPYGGSLAQNTIYRNTQT